MTRQISAKVIIPIKYNALLGPRLVCNPIIPLLGANAADFQGFTKTLIRCDSKTGCGQRLRISLDLLGHR
jgi:hypothetical protein